MLKDAGLKPFWGNYWLSKSQKTVTDPILTIIPIISSADFKCFFTKNGWISDFKISKKAELLSLAKP